MLTTRFLVALCIAAVLIPLVGCRHRCCSSNSSSAAPPPAPCCDGSRPAVLPQPGY